MIILLKKFVSNIMEHAAQCLEGDKEQVLFGIFIKKKAVFWYSVWCQMITTKHFFNIDFQYSTQTRVTYIFPLFQTKT